MENVVFRYGQDIVDLKNIKQFTGLHDSTKWDELSIEEQNKWLESHTIDEWIGRPIFEGSIIVEAK